MLDAFIEAASRREQAYPLHTRPEEEAPEPTSRPFSVPGIVEKHGADHIHEFFEKSGSVLTKTEGHQEFRGNSGF
jgi:hypothetical protein